MDKKPIFSILTPVYNVSKFLNASIDSVLKQTFTDWELILVDDGSTDNCGEICDRYAAMYPDKIRVFHNTNHGLIYSRRFAISKACGIYYVVLDSDDSLVPQTLQTIYNKFQEYDCDCVMYGFEKVRENGERIYATQDEEICLTNKRDIYKKILLDHGYNSLWRKAVKASICIGEIDKKLYHIQQGEDRIQSIDILRKCNTVFIIPDILYRYLENTKSITQSGKKKPVAASFEVEEQVLKFLKQENVFTLQDWQEYHTFCIYDFQKQIKVICRHPAPYKEKLKVFKQLKESAFYKDFLSSSAYKKPFAPFYTQFRLNMFKLLCAEVKLYYFLKGKK